MTPRRPDPSLAARWDSAYREGRAPWDIGAPQSAFVRLADAGAFASPVLDCGCGTGEQALMLAARGFEVMGVDLAPTAIRTARQKAVARGLPVEFHVADALHLDALGRTFATIVDSGVFHTFEDDLRAEYVASLAAVVQPGGVIHLLCFSELTPGDAGPRRVTQAELREAFSTGWRVEQVEHERFDVLPDFATERPHAWLARIVRAEQALRISRPRPRR